LPNPVVPNSRDQLIADWRKCLAAAIEAPEEPSSRAAWLDRLRIRLYRFLLSLYGEGNWNAPLDADQGPPVRLGSPDPAELLAKSLRLELAGKPAKDVASIRAVLHSVAGASESTPHAGPLAAGIDRNDWIVVASTNRGLDPELAADALLAKGIVPHVISRQHDIAVEVRGYQASAAAELIAAQYSALRLRPRANTATNQDRPITTSVGFDWPIVFFGLGIAPLVCVFVVILLELLQPGSVELSAALDMFRIVGCIWLGSFSIIGLLYLFAGLRRKSRPRSSR
jgi:hypothetical protein